MGKNQFLSWVGVEYCVKDKIMSNYIIQMMRVDAMEKKPTQAKINHYIYMIQKVKSDDVKDKNDIFKDCQAKWNKEEETEDKLTTPLSVPEHYKKHTIEEQKIIWQKPNRQQPVVGISYKGPEDAKKIDLAGLGQDTKPIYIAKNVEPIEEQSLNEILLEFKDVFAWLYKDLKGVDLVVCQHTIPLCNDAKPSIQHP